MGEECPDEAKDLARQGLSEAIWFLTDMVPELDLDEDTAFMTAARLKRGEALPNTA